MEKKLHPVLAGANPLSHNRFFDEVAAAHYWGIDLDEWGWKTRQARAVMTAYTLVMPVVQAIGDFDRSNFVRQNKQLFE